MSFLVRLPDDQYPDDAFAQFASGQASVGNGRAAVWLSQLAYEDEPHKITAIAEKWAMKRLISFKPPVESILPITRARGFLAEGNGALVVAFAGTDPLVVADWVTDFDFAMGADDIHQGFGKALDAVWPEIRAVLIDRAPTQHLILVGHSLGAALAVLAAWRVLGDQALQNLAIKPQAVYTFGMPRVGSASFAQAFNQTLAGCTIRFVHGDDIVPTVPPPELGFAHVGRLLRCERHGHFDPNRLAPSPSNDPAFASTLLSSLQAGLAQILTGSLPPEIRSDLLGQALGFLPPAIADHLPQSYWSAFERA
jgi:triacylglycerol lipase